MTNDRLPELGVGLSYFSGLEPIVGDASSSVDFVEIEPQTMWFEARSGRYRIDDDALERAAALPVPKLLHSIGFPVGGTRPAEPQAVELLAEMAERLEVPWLSEHLSFNTAQVGGGELLAGFLLPPRQTEAGVAAAVDSIRAFAAQFPVPVAVEVGVNYLRPRSDELPDGVFVGEVIERADCGLLLDLHNLWTNERNGRQSVEEFLDHIPLERVWEIHLAGGSERHGFWLDSHAGPVPDEVLDLARMVIRRLPSLSALVFELFPGYLSVVGLDAVRAQMTALREIWEERPAAPAPPVVPSVRLLPMDEGPSPLEWEAALASLVLRRDGQDDVDAELASDPGIALVSELLDEFRMLMVVTCLKLTARLLTLTLGRHGFRDLLAGYWRTAPPERFASTEAEGFAAYLADRRPGVDHLEEVLAFERAVLATLLDGESRVVPFDHDPMLVLRPLGEGRLPVEPTPGSYEVEVTGDSVDGTIDRELLATGGLPH